MTCDVVNFVFEEYYDEQDPLDPEVNGWAVRVQVKGTEPEDIHDVNDDEWLYLNGGGQGDLEIGFDTFEQAVAGYRRWCYHRGFEPQPVMFGLKGIRR